MVKEHLPILKTRTRQIREIEKMLTMILLHDDTGEQDLFDDEIAKVIILPSGQGLYLCLFGNAI